MDRGLILEVFSCSGALAYGFREAGLHVDMAFDHDADACASYEANMGVRPVQIDVRDLLRMARAGWRPGPIDLLIADPPCTPWSRAGKMLGLSDDRDVLRETAELIGILRPRAYLIGNIPGLQDATNLGIVQEVIGGLARFGYCVADFCVIDAADYGVPQHRIRPFWYGHCGGGHISWPSPTHTDPADLAHPTIVGFDRRLPWVTCREALADLPPEQIGRPVHLRSEGKRRVPRHPPSEMDSPARAMLASAGGGSKRSLTLGRRPASWHGSEPMSSRLGDPDAPASTIMAKVGRAGAGAYSALSWPWDRPSTAVFAETQKIAPAGRSGSHGDPQSENAIVLSEQAAAILQGFPDQWTFAGKTKRSRWAQIGQAVPVAVARAIGLSVAAQLRS